MDAIQICEDMSNKFPESTILLTKQKKKKKKPNKLSKPEKQLFYISLSTIQNQWKLNILNLLPSSPQRSSNSRLAT